MKVKCNKCNHEIEMDAQECEHCHDMDYAVIEDFEDDTIDFNIVKENIINKLLSKII